MATTTKTEPVKTTAQPAAAAQTIRPRQQATPSKDFLFDKSNYMWMIGGFLLILLGFALMAGGKSPDPHKFLADELYSFRRITLAPLICLLGFGIEVYAIMKKPKEA